MADSFGMTMRKLLIIIGLLSAFNLHADEVVLMRYGATDLTSAELRTFMDLAVPEEQRSVLMASESRLKNLVAKLFITHLLAADAEKRELTHDELAFMEAARVRQLSQLQLEHVWNKAEKLDYEAIALENYKANPEKFEVPEAVHARHILISTKNRSDEEAKSLAARVLVEVAQPDASFEDLALKYSDDVSVRKNKGDLGYFGRKKMVPEFEGAVFAENKPGAYIGPIKTAFGYHIIQYMGKREQSVKPFEVVREELIKEAKINHRTRVVEAEIGRLANLSGVVINDEEISKLVNRIEFTTIQSGNK